MFKALKSSSENLTKRLDDARQKMTPRERYKKDFQTRLSWMDFSVLKIDGRAFEPDKALIPVDDAKKFPAVSGYDLNGNKSILPHSMDKQMKFVGFSNNQVGGLYVNSWLNPFFDNYKGNDKVGTVEIHVVERYMLSFLRPLILHRLRSQIPEARHKNTVVMFGGLEDISADLELPKKYSGYTFLLDKNNRIRWRSCGLAKKEDMDTMLNCAKQLVK